MKVSTMQPLTEQEMLDRLLYRDACMLILDKPPGIAVHVTGNDNISLDQSFKYVQFGLKNPPALAHRLDRATSGCLVLGRHAQALKKLGDLFATQKIEKTYLAIVIGKPGEAEGIINRPILKTGKGSKWRMVLDDAGQEAMTHYRVVKTFSSPLEGERDLHLQVRGGNFPDIDARPIPPTETQKRFDSPSRGEFSLVEFFPKTGRTHQIRLHAAFALGCPVMGDPFYASEQAKFADEPMQLHAWKVRIPYYANKPAIQAVAPVPAAMQRWMDRLNITLDQ